LFVLLDGKKMQIDDDGEFLNREKTEDDIDWSIYGDHDQSATSLDGKDILSIFIASIQTIFLPLVLLGIFMLIIGLVIGFLF
jgi:hypothetical protein